MDREHRSYSTVLFSLSFLLILTSRGILATTFTFVNKCQYTVWPGVLANAGSPRLDSTGFELPTDSSRTFQAPTGWSGRFWGRTACKFDGSGEGYCGTGDCGSGQVECNGAGAEPPATLAEFTLGTGSQDFYDVSLVDGYNLAMLVEVSGGGVSSSTASGTSCATTGCLQDLNRVCPTELRVGDGEACKSACEAFGSPEYCCSGAFGSPDTCKPSVYSQMFKSACPRSYSYAYDDATSTFTCSNADYIITFCPSTSSSQKSTDIPTTTPPATPVAVTTPITPGVPGGSNVPGTTGPGSAMSYGAASAAGVGSSGSGSGVGSSGLGSEAGSGSDSAALLAEGSWLAGLAMGDSLRTAGIPSHVQTVGVAASSLLCYLLYL